MRKLLVLRASWMSRRTKTMWVNYILCYIIFPLSEHKFNLDNPASNIHPCTVTLLTSGTEHTHHKLTIGRGGRGWGSGKNSMQAQAMKGKEMITNYIVAWPQEKGCKNTRAPWIYVHLVYTLLPEKTGYESHWKGKSKVLLQFMLGDCSLTAQSPVFYRQRPEKTANNSRLNHWFPHKMMSEKWQ